MSCLQAEKLASSFLPKMSHDTLLRLNQATPTHVSIPSVVGLNDSSFRKGHDYGKLICDLITHQPLAILSDRTGKTVTQWLKQHSQIQMVSRDGSITYREAIEKANPKIQQVSDRWHLMKMEINRTYTSQLSRRDACNPFSEKNINSLVVPFINIWISKHNVE
ncbi:hypothetical protein CEW92_11710 [Bacillaceae bacterium SAS-127]|nr:hypothetical protein CEW92_11710 [Bacillaceae bacterium SAS-127]